MLPAPGRIMNFVGVSTGTSFVNRVFDEWCRCLGVDGELVGIDVPIGSPAGAYRQIVEAIRGNPMIRGALVTTHKARMFEATGHLFDDVQNSASDLREIGAIFRVGKRLTCEATDPAAVSMALHRIRETVPNRVWHDAVVIGGGGAGLALAYVLASDPSLGVKTVTIIEASETRVKSIREVARAIECCCDLRIEYSPTGAADEYVERAASSCLVVNATGMGKDIPGSPLSSNCRIPIRSTLWDFNYRGTLQFLSQAKPCMHELEISLIDGWHYFVCGWYQVMTRVFGVDRSDHLFAAFERVAEGKKQGS
jgi:shikimate dehydrogenase